MDTGLEAPRQLISEITAETDTRDILAHAERQGRKEGFADCYIVDIDCHHQEVESWLEVAKYIEDEVIRWQALDYAKNRTGAPPYGLNGDLALRYQDCGGRIIHQGKRGEKVEDKSVHRDVVLQQRAYQAMHVDYSVMFPTSMLNIGGHPQFDMESILGAAYNRWFVDHIASADDKIGTMIFLPFNDPAASLRTVEEFIGKKGVVGFMITSVRHKPVHHNEYMKVYRAIEEAGLPLGFHAGYHWQDQSMAQINRFGAMHALGFVWHNVVHMTNWIWNGLPERFPKLNVLWIESGLAWVTWLMQRLDHQYLMRTSEAPLLKRLPSEYMAEMFYTSQPLETDHRKALECTLEMIKAETQLLYASDWPHWDFDTPATIWELPNMSEQGKRNILGLNAARIFNLPVPAAKRGRLAAAAE